jgi:high-affinity nickel permease
MSSLLLVSSAMKGTRIQRTRYSYVLAHSLYTAIPDSKFRTCYNTLSKLAEVLEVFISAPFVLLLSLSNYCVLPLV